MTKQLQLFIAACLTAVLTIASCTSHTVIPATPSTFTVLVAGGKAGVSAPAGSADAGSAVTISSGGTGSGTAASDGSIAFNGTAASGTVTLSYTKQSQPLTTDATTQPLTSRVTKPLFTTGSAPNDMELASGALYVANSLDNSVVAYGLDGATLHTASFPEFSSPSYVAADGSNLYVVRNGDNLVSGLALADLQPVAGQDYQLTDAAVSFIGPGRPAFAGGVVFVPRTQIATFSPTVYGSGLVTAIDRSNSGAQATTTASGLSTGTVQTLADGRLAVVSAGDVQFDENFLPFVASDSYLDVYTVGAGGALTLDEAVNLGHVGANSIASKGEVAYVGNVLDGHIYRVDLAQTPPAVAPIALTSEFTYISDLEFVGDTDLLLATSFNTDELYVIDTATGTVSPAPYPGPFDLSLDPDLLAGALGVEVDTSTNPATAYVLFSVANAVAKVQLLP